MLTDAKPHSKKRLSFVLVFCALLTVLVGYTVFKISALSSQASVPILWEILAHSKPVAEIRFTPNSQSIVSAGADTYVRVWNLQGKQTAQFEALGKNEIGSLPTSAIALSPDGKILVIASHTTYPRIGRLLEARNLATGRQLWRIEAIAHAIAFSPDGKTIACVADNYQIEMRNSRTGVVVRRLHQSLIINWKPLQFSPDGNFLASGHYNSKVNLWDWQSGKWLRDFIAPIVKEQHLGSENSTSALIFSRDSQRLFIGSRDYISQTPLQVWDVIKGTLLARLVKPVRVAAMALSPNERELAVSIVPNPNASDKHRELLILDAQTLRTKRVILDNDESHASNCLAFSSNGAYLASGDIEGKIRVWSTSNLKAIPAS